MKKLLVAVALIGALSGCQSFNDLQSKYAYKRGTHVTQEQIESFSVRESKKSDIIALLGEPQKTSNVGQKEVLEYHYQQINHLSGGVDQAVKFYFNKKGVLVDTKTVAGSHFGNPLTDG